MEARAPTANDERVHPTAMHCLSEDERVDGVQRGDEKHGDGDEEREVDADEVDLTRVGGAGGAREEGREETHQARGREEERRGGRLVVGLQRVVDVPIVEHVQPAAADGVDQRRREGDDDEDGEPLGRALQHRRIEGEVAEQILQQVVGEDRRRVVKGDQAEGPEGGDDAASPRAGKRGRGLSAGAEGAYLQRDVYPRRDMGSLADADAVSCIALAVPRAAMGTVGTV